MALVSFVKQLFSPFDIVLVRRILLDGTRRRYGAGQAHGCSRCFSSVYMTLRQKNPASLPPSTIITA